jgi:uncharacterized protein
MEWVWLALGSLAAHPAWLRGAAGGVAIGAASALLLLLEGRIAGISGILGSALQARGGERLWRLAFLAGLPLGALIFAAAAGAPRPRIEAGALLLVAGGLLVGYGTRLGSGCTSGHGVCGLARGSRRSLAATLTFMLAGAATVFVRRHLL